MDGTELQVKINLVIQSMKQRIIHLESKIDKVSANLEQQKEYKETNQKKYRYELEKYNYQIIKNQAEINRCRLFIDRCVKYLKYLNTIKQADIITIKQAEYDIIKNIQEEAIYFYTTKIEVLKQRKIVENICEVKTDTEQDIENIQKDRDKIYSAFENKEFHFDQEAIYTTDYLDFDVIGVANKLYLIDQNKKSRKAS